MRGGFLVVAETRVRRSRDEVVAVAAAELPDEPAAVGSFELSEASFSSVGCLADDFLAVVAVTGQGRSHVEPESRAGHHRESSGVSHPSTEESLPHVSHRFHLLSLHLLKHLLVTTHELALHLVNTAELLFLLLLATFVLGRRELLFLAGLVLLEIGDAGLFLSASR